LSIFKEAFSISFSILAASISALVLLFLFGEAGSYSSDCFETAFAILDVV
jgi:hypothetical protein